MNYAATIRNLEEKRDFYAAAANALRKVAAAEGDAGDPAMVVKRGRKGGFKLSAETRARMAAAQQRRHAEKRAAEASTNGTGDAHVEPSTVVQ